MNRRFKGPKAHFLLGNVSDLGMFCVCVREISRRLYVYVIKMKRRDQDIFVSFDREKTIIAHNNNNNNNNNKNNTHSQGWWIQ